jgi:hypothetical protein
MSEFEWEFVGCEEIVHVFVPEERRLLQSIKRLHEE